MYEILMVGFFLQSKNVLQISLPNSILNHFWTLSNNLSVPLEAPYFLPSHSIAVFVSLVVDRPLEVPVTVGVHSLDQKSVSGLAPLLGQVVDVILNI